MDQNIEPVAEPVSSDVQVKGTELEEAIAHIDSVKDRLTGTDADRFIDMTKPVETDNRTPSEVVAAIETEYYKAEGAFEDAMMALSVARTALVRGYRQMEILRNKQRAYDEAMMKANAQISAGLPKYPKMLYGLNGGTFIATTEAIHKNIENHTRTWPNATKLGWFETPTERDNYAKAHGLL